MSQAGRGLTSWTSMNENLMALLEAVLTLAASDASANTIRRTSSIKPGGYSEDIFLNLPEDEQEELSCGICYQVLKEAMQCPNRHKFCHSCLVVWSTTGQYANRVRCPVCRCQGYYLHDHELDSRIDKKRVKCNVENCRWTGTLKYLGVHSNTHSGAASASGSQAAPQPQREDETDEDEEDDDDDDDDDGNILELPYLGRATPQLPHRSQSRFTGTGLQARSMMTTAGAAAASVSREANRGGDPRVQTVTTSLLDRSSGGGGGTGLQRRPRQANTSITAENPVLLRERRNANNSTTESSPSTATAVGGGAGILLRERRNANTLNANTDSSSNTAVHREARTNSAHHRVVRRNSNANAEASTADVSAPATTARQSVRQRVHPIRRANRISISHTNNNSSNSTNTTTGNNLLYSSEIGTSTTPRQPRPPSAPRPPNQAARRNLPVLSTASSPNPRGQQSNSPSPTHIIRAPPTFNSNTASRGISTNQGGNASEFQDQLRESRERLEGLMSSFSGELERSRQEMAEFQVERERQRREQLTEVRELGRRLGQVASELRLLLNQRPRLRPDSDE